MSKSAENGDINGANEQAEAELQILRDLRRREAEPEKSIIEIMDGTDEPPSQIMSAEVAHSMLQSKAVRISQEKRAADQVIRQYQSGAEIKFRKALDMRSKVHNLVGRAKILADRHNEQLRGTQFIKIILDCAEEDEDLARQAREQLEHFQDGVNRYGFFLMRYSEEMEKKRLCPGKKYWQHDPEKKPIPEYIVAEAWGRHPDPKNPLNNERVVAADCQIHLPLPSKDVPPVVEMPYEGDEFRDEAFVKYLEEHPYAVGIIEDLVCEQRMAELRLASVALSKGLRHIQVANENRKIFNITHVTAAIADLCGVIKPDGKEIRLKQDLLVPPVCNERSRHVFSHFRSEFVTPFRTVYILKNRTVPVLYQNQQYEIIVDWIVKACELRKS